VPRRHQTNIAEASFTRPKKLASTGYNTNEKTIEFMRHHYSFGIDPSSWRRYLKRESKTSSFISCRSQGRKDDERASRAHGEFLHAGRMKRQEELNKKRMEERIKHPMPGLEGRQKRVGRAREDLTWVKSRGPDSRRKNKFCYLNLPRREGKNVNRN